MVQRKQGSIGQVFPQEMRAVVSAVVVVSVAVPSSADIARYKGSEVFNRLAVDIQSASTFTAFFRSLQSYSVIIR